MYSGKIAVPPGGGGIVYNNIEVINSLSSLFCKFFEKITILKKDKITINIQITPSYEINNTPICCEKHFWPTASL
jgi:hypothetical protein